MENQIFSLKANEFWQINGPFKTLHDINPTRLDFIEKNLEYQDKTLKNQTILDCGCGAGILAESLAAKEGIVLALDAAKEIIEVAKKHALKNSLAIEYLAMNSDEMKAKLKQSQFDIITCLEMLEHTKNPEKIIADLSFLLKKEGLIFFSTLNRNFNSFFKAIVIGEYLTDIIPKGTHHYSQFIKPSELDEACRKNQLELVNLTGLSYNPITRGAKLIDECSLNYLACYIKR